MPDMSENPTGATGGGKLSQATRREERSPSREREEPGDAPPRPPRAGALFRALLKAGCDMESAYTAAEEAKRMAGENVATENVVTLTHLSGNLDTLVAMVGGLAERMDGLAGRMDGLAERVDTLTERVDGLTARVDGLTERVDGLTARVDGLTARVDGLTARVDGLAERMDRQEEKLDTLAVKVDGQGETLADHGARLQVLAVRMDGLQREMRLMWGALGALVTVLGLVFTLLFSR